LFVVGEFWISAAAPPERRGLVVGLYATALAIGFAVGPVLLAASGPQGFLPFVVGASVFVVAALPVVAARGDLPLIEESGAKSLIHIMRAAPIPALAALLFGAIETGGMGLLPVYAIRAGFSAETGPWLVSAVAFGNVLLAIPIGYLADRMNRLRLLRLITLAGLAGVLAMPAATSAGVGPLAALLLVWGGITGALYGIGLAEYGALYTGADLANANAAMVMLYALGTVLGPLLLGLGLDLWQPFGLPAVLAVLFLAYLAIQLRRTTYS
jgi:MFS family permease